MIKCNSTNDLIHHIVNQNQHIGESCLISDIVYDIASAASKASSYYSTSFVDEEFMIFDNKGDIARIKIEHDVQTKYNSHYNYQYIEGSVTVTGRVLDEYLNVYEHESVCLNIEEYSN